MADVLAAALWCGSILAWREGLRGNRPRWLLLAAVSCAACILTKYVGLGLLPLLAAYTVVQRRAVPQELLFLLLPIAVFAVFSWWMHERYGVLPLLLIADYAQTQRMPNPPGSLTHACLILAFAGGAFLPALFLLPWLVTRRWLLATLLGMAGLAVALSGRAAIGPHSLRLVDGTDWILVLHLSAFAVTGAAVFFVTARFVHRRRDADAWLIGLWIGGILFFAGVLNWSTNVRALLPAAPAIAMVIADEVRLAWRAHAPFRWAPYLAWTVSLLASFQVAWGDAAAAGSARRAAEEIARDHLREGHTLWFQGAWGFQHYAEAAGARKIDRRYVMVEAGDRVVNPAFNTNIASTPEERSVRLERRRVPLHAWASTMFWGAGFYSDRLGPVPFRFGPAPADIYFVLEARLPWRTLEGGP
jgi:hypothetical protein